MASSSCRIPWIRMFPSLFFHSLRPSCRRCRTGRHPTIAVALFFGRFPPMDLSHDNSVEYDEGAEVLIRARSESSMGDAGDAALTVDADLNSTREAVALTVAPSETSTGRDDTQAPGWTRRYTISIARVFPIHTCSEFLFPLTRLTTYIWNSISHKIRPLQL